MKNAYKILVGKQRPLGKPRHRDKITFAQGQLYICLYTSNDTQ